MTVSQESVSRHGLRSRKQACKFLGSVTHLEPTAMEELWFACENIASARVDGPRSFVHEKAWICARPTTHHDLQSVIPDEQKEKDTDHDMRRNWLLFPMETWRASLADQRWSDNRMLFCTFLCHLLL